MQTYLDFEKPIAELEAQIEELRHVSDGADINIAEEVTKLQAKLDRLLRQTYSKLTAWQKVQVARHLDRPSFAAYVKILIEDFTPLSGDRVFAEDEAIVGGLGRFNGRSIIILGQERGWDTESRVRHGFGSARPEGYRKAQRLMRLGEHFGLPIVTMIDTKGAYPGIDAEARGQAEAIARSMDVCLDLRVPLVSVVIGEGGSGGAIAIGAANTVLMLEHAIYSVISPEGCGSILWRDSEHVQEAAEALKLTAQDLMKLGIIDQIIAEPLGGAHRDKEKTITAVGEALEENLLRLERMDGNQLRARRRTKFLEMGTSGVN